MGYALSSYYIDQCKKCGITKTPERNAEAQNRGTPEAYYKIGGQGR